MFVEQGGFQLFFSSPPLSPIVDAQTPSLEHSIPMDETKKVKKHVEVKGRHTHTSFKVWVQPRVAKQ